MNKTNSDNEVYEESDLPTRPVQEGRALHADAPAWPGLLRITEHKREITTATP